MTSVLVIEDEPATRQVLTDLLTHLGYDTSSAESGARGLEMMASAEPDLVVLDLGLPDVSGLEVLRDLRTWSEAPVVVVSGSTQHRRKAEALDAGADDFLDKPFNVGELRARLRAAERRLASTTVDSAMARSFGSLLIDPSTRRVERDGREVRLTDTEWQLLEAMSRQPGRIVTHRWLAKLVWGPRAGAESTASLRSHLRALRAKLGDDARDPLYIRTESGVGYRWICPATVAAPAGAPDPHTLARQFRGDLESALRRLRNGTSPGSERSRALASRLRGLGDEIVDLAQTLVDEVVDEEDPPRQQTGP